VPRDDFAHVRVELLLRRLNLGFVGRHGVV
jgi:hypothetical protein